MRALAKTDLGLWRQELQNRELEVEAKRELLKQKNVQLDLAHIDRLVSDENKLNVLLAKLKADKRGLTHLQTERRRIMAELWSIRGRRAASTTLLVKVLPGSSGNDQGLEGRALPGRCAVARPRFCVSLGGKPRPGGVVVSPVLSGGVGGGRPVTSGP